jgi:SAM-dependent methyltransferase
MSLVKKATRPLSDKLTRITLGRFIQRHADPGLTLDIGAQTGPYAAWFPHRVAIDIRPRTGIQVVSDAQTLAVADASVDVVLCTEVLEHLREPQRAIDEFFRVLKPGGALLLTTRFLFPIHDAPDDYFRFTKYGLRYLLRAFTIDELEEETTTVGTLAALVQRLAMQTDPPGFGAARAGWLVVAQLLRPLSFLVAREFGDSRRTVPERGVMTTGYHVCCRKPGRPDRS